MKDTHIIFIFLLAADLLATAVLKLRSRLLTKIILYRIFPRRMIVVIDRD
jgi:hypothetical protein